MILFNSIMTMAMGISLILLVPGPTNSLLLVSGLKKGILETSPLIIAEACGYITAIVFWTILLSTIGRNIPLFPEILKILCSLYIFYLAIKVWSFGEFAKSNNSISFNQMVIASALNPKALLFVTLFIPANLLSSINGFALFSALFLGIMIPIGFLWVSLGGVIKKISSQNVLGVIYKTISLVLMMLSSILFYTVIK
ncbi:lysine transporter LysE [Klebsiella aerogenes]|uniref:LysE family translocator n=1 Tax=Klebsiella aerogenes TaxID=548 RepID=UPI000C76306B|nr:LysE family transporter [Klebsiella aerogenes]EKZ5284317.1 LysE family transporter [Klebsiella aerogenes]MCR1575442.1 LysE family transporter [Klebsiella aerogenes]MDT4322964.1 LysE family transporter [Klebsiella aerogenes]PLC37347.1 lysine transporter LysE [Klebsiella aerogenes]